MQHLIIGSSVTIAFQSSLSSDDFISGVVTNLTDAYVEVETSTSVKVVPFASMHVITVSE